MLKCPSCERTQDKGKFCRNCGEVLEEVGEQKEASNNSAEQAVEEQQPTRVSEENINVEDGPKTQAEQVGADYDKKAEKPEVDFQQEAAAATATQQPVHQQDTTAEVKTKLQNYWQYSVQLLRNPNKAFSHQEDKFVYGLVNLALYALMFSLVIASIVKSVNIGIEYYFDSTGALYLRLIVYLFIAIAIALGVVLVSLLALEKMFIKRMTFKEMVVQYSGLLIPLIFIQAIVLLFTLIGTSFFVFVILSAILFFGLSFLPAIFMYEKVKFYQASENHTYIAMGTIVFITVAFIIVTIIVGESLLSEMLDEILYYI